MPSRNFKNDHHSPEVLNKSPAWWPVLTCVKPVFIRVHPCPSVVKNQLQREAKTQLSDLPERG